MKSTRLLSILPIAIVLTGCASSRDVGVNLTPAQQYGAGVGTVVGAATGAAVAANPWAGAAIGGGAGMVVGSVIGTIADNAGGELRIVRTWSTEVTTDGRTIQVPKEFVVDEYGRIIRPYNAKRS
ncbi:MAG: hypothetical protein SFY80_15655 [Verrucomicrobiota bacterium]|nr:hypothetical protein [Verrucomicrobiota bacterium]